MRRLISVAVLCALIMAPVPSAVAAEESLSGTILTGGDGLRWFVGDRLSGCQMSPDCRAWLETDCDPALSGRDPAPTASIEDIGGFADGVTPWTFQFEPDFEYGGWVTVQLWQEGCVEIESSRWRSVNSSGECAADPCESISLVIPRTARWMTVTGYPSGPPWIGDVVDPGWITLDWTLKGSRSVSRGSGPAPSPAESPTPQPAPTEQPEIPRSLDLALRGHLRGVGSVVSEDASCTSNVPVLIQRKKLDGWLDVASSTTDADGAFALRLSDRSGRFRAIAPEVGTQESTCLVARSATVRHQH